MKKILIIIMCLAAVFVFTGAKKSKKAPSKTSKAASVSKEKIASLEKQNAELAAKVSSLETDLKKLKKDSDMKFMIAASSAGGLLLVLIIVIAVSAGGKRQAAEQGGSESTSPGKEKHFEDLEYHVLNDWQNIWFHPENIDMKLYEDLKNHFGELYNSIEDWKEKFKSREELCLKLNKKLASDFSDIEATPSIYMLFSDEASPFVEGDEIKAGPYLCAHIKPGCEAAPGKMPGFYDAVIAIGEDRPFSEIKKFNIEIAELKNEIDVKIRKIKFVRELPGQCEYMQG
jgi:hypothetical protein